MTLREIVRAALRGIRRRPLRNGLAMIGVALASATLVTLLTLSNAARRDVLGGLETQPLATTIQVTPASARAGVAPRPIDGQAVRDIAALSGVREVIPLLTVPATLRLGDRGPSGTVTGLRLSGPAPFAFLSGRVARADEADAIVLTPAALRGIDVSPAAILGQRVQLEFRRSAGTQVTRIDARVVGVSAQEIPGLALVPLPIAEDGLAWITSGESTSERDLRLAQQAAASLLFGGGLLGTDLATSRYSSLWVMTRSLDDVLPTKRAIEDAGWAAYSSEAVLQTVEDIFRAVNALLVAVAAAGLLLAGLGVVNALVTTVSERTVEIGVLKALGATDRTVALLVVSEGAIVSVAGAVLGIALGWSGAKGAALLGAAVAGRTNLALDPQAEPLAALAALAGSIALGGVAAFIPARRASQLAPADALRAE